jgi:hypothetical protein
MPSWPVFQASDYRRDWSVPAALQADVLDRAGVDRGVKVALQAQDAAAALTALVDVSEQLDRSGCLDCHCMFLFSVSTSAM